MRNDIPEKLLLPLTLGCSGKKRQLRWNRVFSSDSGSVDQSDQKATIIIEHVMQASDVGTCTIFRKSIRLTRAQAHTMQHWDIFRKWNRRLFFEMKSAFHQERAADDPAKSW